MKHLLACLFIGCLVGPAWGAAPTMTLEEFVQKLEKAEPWARENVEALLGIKFTVSPFGRYEAYGQFVYVKSLIFKEIELIVSSDPEDSGKTLVLSLELDDRSACITWEQIEKSYPGGGTDFIDAFIGEVSYVKKQPWGELEFVFGYTKKGDCLITIMIGTNAQIKKGEPRILLDDESIEKILKESNKK